MKKMGYPDRPVVNITEDLFNVEVYVNALCSFIRGCETPMTISIQGDWGSGKTSMMNMMRANMQADVWPVWFNTWQFSQFDMGGALAFSMMDVILKGLDCNPDHRKKILSGIIGFGKRVIRNVSDYTLGGEITGMISNTLDGSPLDSDYAAEITELKNRFLEAVKAKLEKEHRDRVVIFVDDLDRLQPAKAVELLEVLKLFLDCEKCVFVLAVDYEVVTLGIKQKFGEDVSSEKGRSFFDKIIQLPFKMPVANYDIRKYVKEMMERINVSTEDKEIDLFYNLIQASIGFNPRSMKRLFNTYELLDIVTESTVKRIDTSVRKRVLFAIICMQMCFEKLYLYFTSTLIDEDTFSTLKTSDGIAEALKEIYGKSAKDCELEVEHAKMFIPYLLESLQTDDSMGLSVDELNNFKIILKCSTVTSVSAKGEEQDSTAKEWEYRDKNKYLVKETAAKLSDIGKFSAWMPRKAHDGIKFSDISGWHVWTTAAGFNCTLDYYLTRTSDYIIRVDLRITLNQGKGLESLFFETLGDNPLKLVATPQKAEWGRYTYSNLLRVNANDSNAADQIASIVRTAYASINSVIEARKNNNP